jgi:threonine synthase
MSSSRTSFVTRLEAAIDGTPLDHRFEATVHEGRPLWVRYDLEAVRASLARDVLGARPPTLWRWREILPLPIDREPVTLGEHATPLVEPDRLARALGLGKLWIKDESRLPTGSFKDRGMAVAVNMALAFGRTRFTLPTNGNAGGALAAYAAAAGAEAHIFMPHDTPAPNVAECARAGARTYLVRGLISDCGRVAREAAAALDAFDLSTLREPYRIEGKKTMGLELAAELGWSLPDIILYPTGGGTGLIGMWKAFHELRDLGWLASPALPRMVAVQSDGCAPIVRAFEAGKRFAEPWEGARSAAAGIRVPGAVGDFMILDAVRESGGVAVAVEDSRIDEWRGLAARLTGLAICPEAGACVGAALLLRARGLIGERDRVVIFNTASGHKYEPAVPADLPVIDPTRPIVPQLGVGGIP